MATRFCTMEGAGMEGWRSQNINPRHLSKGAALLCSLLLLLALLSFDLADPTLSNLRAPAMGVGNLLGIPGALLGGSLLELLGSAALLIPFLAANWALLRVGRPHPAAYLGWSLLLLFALSGLHGLLPAPAMPPLPEAVTGPAVLEAAGTPGLWSAGLVGWALREWCALTTGPWLGGALLALLALASLRKVAYTPGLGRAVRDMRLFSGWFGRSVVHAGAEAGTAVGRGARGFRHGLLTAAELVVGTIVGLIVGTWLGVTFPFRWTLGRLRALFTPSVGKIKARGGSFSPAMGPGAHAGQSAPAGRAPAGASSLDAFDQWFANDGDALPGSFTAPAQAAADAPRENDAMTQPVDDAASPPGPAGQEDDRPGHGAGFSALLEDEISPPGDQAEEAEDTSLADAIHHPLHPAEVPWEDVPAWETQPPGKTPDSAGFSAHTEEPDAPEEDVPLADPSRPGHRFEQPEAESAWRDRFKRYARNLDLDWEEQVWRDEAAAKRPDPSTTHSEE